MFKYTNLLGRGEFKVSLLGSKSYLPDFLNRRAEGYKKPRGGVSVTSYFFEQRRPFPPGTAVESRAVYFRVNGRLGSGGAQTLNPEMQRSSALRDRARDAPPTSLAIARATVSPLE